MTACSYVCAGYGYWEIHLERALQWHFCLHGSRRLRLGSPSGNRVNGELVLGRKYCNFLSVYHSEENHLLDIILRHLVLLSALFIHKLSVEPSQNSFIQNWQIQRSKKLFLTTVILASASCVLLLLIKKVVVSWICLRSNVQFSKGECPISEVFVWFNDKSVGGHVMSELAGCPLPPIHNNQNISTRIWYHMIECHLRNVYLLLMLFNTK